MCYQTRNHILGTAKSPVHPLGVGGKETFDWEVSEEGTGNETPDCKHASQNPSHTRTPPAPHMSAAAYFTHDAVSSITQLV